MKPYSGTYALILKAREEKRIQIGRWGSLDIQLGYYIYIGSAFGPGGVKARVSRHFRSKKPHWHIDYLSENIILQEAWLSYDELRLEHIWANSLLNNANYQAIKGFGCSDCNCYSHLFFTQKNNFEDFEKITKSENNNLQRIRRQNFDAERK